VYLQRDLLFLAHLGDKKEGPINVDVADLTRFLDAEGDGVHWSLADSGDLNVNLVRLGPGRMMAEHANHELDVVLVVLAGTGRLVVDDIDWPLAAAVVALIPKGTTRAFHAGAEGMAYLTVHRRRAPLGISPAGRPRR
jgi:quercetin dioxygenase-like cupin family protein